MKFYRSTKHSSEPQAEYKPIQQTPENTLFQSNCGGKQATGIRAGDLVWFFGSGNHPSGLLTSNISECIANLRPFETGTVLTLTQE